MKILSIRIKNLASLEGIAEIDFTKEPLLSAGIFAITGPTGAGKSTLLDALCLALYAKTPRYLQAKETGIELHDVVGSKIGQGDTRGILRDGTADGFAEVSFVGVDGIPYTASWGVRRARNKAEGSLQNYSMALINLSTNINIGGTRTEIQDEIERLVGLNFEQFTRSVLLAQGDFTAFLKADKDAKSSLLEKLTGTDIYSNISKLIYEKSKEASDELKNLRSKMEGIAILSDEELSNINIEKLTLAQQIKEGEAELALLAEEITWHQQWMALSTSKEKATQALTLAETEREAATERINLLTQVESIQPIRTLVDAKQNNAHLLQQKNNEYEVNLLKINELTLKIPLLSNQLAQADILLAESEKAQFDAQPAIEQAKQLDILIKEKTTQTANAKQEYDIAFEKHQQVITVVKEKELEVTRLEDRAQALQKWKAENSPRQAIAENIVIISSKLADAANILPLREKFAEDIKASGARNIQIDKDITLLGNQLVGQEKELEGLHSIFNTTNKELSSVPINDLQANEANLVLGIQEIIAAKGHWDLQFATLKLNQEISDKLKANKLELEGKTKTFASKQVELREAEIKKEQSGKMLLQAHLKTTENVEGLRGELIEGQECPVCGSIHHPFVAQSIQLHNVLEGLENESNACNALYNELLRETSSLEQQCKKLNADNLVLEKELVLKANDSATMEGKWQSFKIDATCSALPPAQKSVWLENERNRLEAALQAVRLEVGRYSKLKSTHDTQKAQMEGVEKKLVETRDSLKDALRVKQSLKEQIASLSESLSKANNELESVIDFLNHYFTREGWVEAWKQDAGKFELVAHQFAKEWNARLKELEESTNNLNILKTSLEGISQQLTASNADVATKQGKLAEYQENLSFLTTERKAIFNGEEVAIIQQKLSAAIQDAQIAYKQVVAEKAELDAQLLRLNTTESQLKADIEKFTIEVEKNYIAIINWLSVYNEKYKISISEEHLIVLLSYTQEWIGTERGFINVIYEAVTKAKATLDERSWQLKEHESKKVAERGLDEVSNLHDAFKQSHAAITTAANELEFKLRLDMDNKQKVGRLLKEMESQDEVSNNWAKLNDLIGSADGKKFRQIAQEYTLDSLLGYANVHLQALSHRYKLLRIPNSLGLQVLDMDMGDELRTVFSLSGGESFLVSLALALGLASLSSNKMKVESLFIDEGFGSLDPVTLNIAVDALERLHNQGRKVGVISHVEEMTERIPTQIKVSKMANGRSRVEVVGNFE
ncbi:AAA family ATPase [Parasediminibacterium sp. JCM 36343]|uniref:AAA family ATPase n=1 Tax=Parasediminibacterium sp. JCM 36343 TaxID=3374279 RepID=UPI00397DA762